MHIAEAETEEKKNRMLPTYRDAEGSYYRETEGEGAPHHQTEKESSGHYPGGRVLLL